ncbi:MAG: response regulator [Bacteroidetes bacterium]|nr:response regulator [Bacteroidota bacterium]
MPKFFSFKIIITSIVLAMLIILTAIGVFTYFRLTSIVDTVSNATQPDARLVNLKHIQAELSDAESSIKSYVLTRNNDYLTPFYNSLSSIDERIEFLRRLCRDDANERILIDSVNTLVVKKYEILNELLTLNDDALVTSELKKISQKIAEAEQKQEKRLDSLRKHASSAEMETVPQKSSIFQKIFGKKEKAPELKKDTLFPPTGTINIKTAEIKNEIENVKDNQTQQIQERKQQEFTLVGKDKEIMDKIRYLIGQLEKQETSKLIDKTKESRAQADETKILIATFCIAAILMLLIASFVITIYIRHNQAYRTALKKAKTDAENLTRVEEKFIINMSHEIRTPMNAIIGFTNLILKTPLVPEQKQYIDAVKTSGENLLVIINDILDFSKMQSGKITLEQINFRLSQVISTLTEFMLPKSIEKSIKLSMNIDKNISDYLIGDPTRLNQILLNLISNAIKFTEKGEVKTSISLVSEDDKKLELKFSVTDTGIGIPREKFSAIFEEFTQATDDTTRKYGGSGLGLAIVKELVEMQGGKISVESTVGVGSTFSFNLKFEKNLQQNMEPEHLSHEENKVPVIEGLNILLVEDNILNQILAKKVLTNWNWNVELAENGLIAIEKLENQDFDIVLMDIQLPEMDGYEATHYIRNKFSHPKCHIPIMAMTAHAMSSEEEKCRLAGMNGYISKPFDQKVLYSRIIFILNECGYSFKKNAEIKSAQQ